MSVSVEGGKGRGKSMGVDLNLVPFIDFLSCLIAFLMMTAVWAEIHALAVEQSVSPPNLNEPPPEVPPVPPLTVHIREDGLWIARKAETGVNLPKVGESYDWDKLTELMVADHALLPAEDMVVINTDHGVHFEHMVKALDISRKIGYPKTALAGGPASATKDGVPPAVVPPVGG